MRGRILQTLAAIFTVGCGSTSISPTASGATPQPINLFGNVSNSVAGPVDAARVSVTDGASAGATTLTGSDGSFRLSYNASSEGHLQVTKDGYVPTVVSVPSGFRTNGVWSIILHVATSANLAGTYAATFVADRACGQIPEAMRTRQYDAVVDQPSQFPQNTQFAVKLSGAQFAQGTENVPLDSFYGFIEGTSVRLDIANSFELVDVEEGIAEQIAAGVRLEIFGRANLAVLDPGSLSAAMTGYFAVTDASGIHKCDSSNHLVMLRQRR